MKWLTTIIGELVALFIDDVWFAAAIVVWLALLGLLLPHLSLPIACHGPLLAGGLLAILVESVMRRVWRP